MFTDPIQFYKSQIKSEYHNDRRFNCGLTHDTTGQLLGSLWLKQYDEYEEADPVDADSLFNPLVQTELAKMLTGQQVNILPGVSFAVHAEDKWSVYARSDEALYGLVGRGATFQEALANLLPHVRRQAYEVANDSASQDLVEDLYRTYFLLEDYYNRGCNV